MSSLKPVIAHAVEQVEAQGDRVDVVVWLQATSPFRSAADIERALDRLLGGGFDSVVSVTEDRTLNWREENGALVPLRIAANAPTSSLEVAASGHVGLGTASPAAPFHVQRTTATGLFMQLERNGDLFFRLKNSVTGQFADMNLIGDEYRINFGTGGPGPELRLTSTGSLIISGTYTPDYVFDSDYTLMPLAELADFVARERHLPNVPNAAEIREQGLNVNVFPMQLLEKIEELTLYTLQQERTIARQERLLADLEARLSALESERSERPAAAR